VSVLREREGEREREREERHHQAQLERSLTWKINEITSPQKEKKEGKVCLLC